MAKSTEAEKPKSMFIDEGIDEGLRWGTLDIDGTIFKIRQLTVTEGDDNYDASYNDKENKFNNRLNSRLNLAASIISPSTSIDDMGKWPGTKLVALLRAFDKLNILPEADTEGKRITPVQAAKLRKAQSPNGPRLLGRYLTDRYLERASVARFWRTTPESIRLLSEIEYQRMREFALRTLDPKSPGVPPPKIDIDDM